MAPPPHVCVCVFCFSKGKKKEHEFCAGIVWTNVRDPDWGKAVLLASLSAGGDGLKNICWGSLLKQNNLNS